VNERPKRLLFVIDSLGAGGAQNQLGLLAAGLAARGHHVEVAQYYPDDDFGWRLDAAGVTRHRFSKRDRAGASVARDLRALVARGRFDVVTSYMDRPGLYAALATVGPGRPPLVVSHRSITRWSTLGMAERALRRWTNRHAARIVCNSRHECRTWLALLPGADVRSIWNGLPAADGNDDMHAKPDVRTEASGATLQSDDARAAVQPEAADLTVDDGDTLLLCVGTITPDKNLESLIDALVLARERGSRGVRVACLGAPKQTLPRDVAYDARLRARVAAAGLGDSWRWLGHRADPRPWYGRADALVHVARTEGLPNVVCEAQCAALPVLIGAVLDHPLMVEDGVSGMLCDPNDPASIATAIERFVALDDRARASLGRAARQHAENAYSMTRFLDEHERLYDELTSPGTGATG